MRLTGIIGLAAALALTLGTACSKSASDATEGGKTFGIYPPQLFAGFDGTNTFKAPALVYNMAGTVTWALDDPSLAMLLPADNGEHVMVVAKKAGDTRLKATSGSTTLSIPLKVYTYESGQHAIGETRYTVGPDGKADPDNPPCVKCHAPGLGPDHSPTEIDADPDSDIVNTFLSGVDPEGRPVGMEFADKLKKPDGTKYTHMWKVSDAEKAALPAYLRSLEPHGYPEVDPDTKKN